MTFRVEGVAIKTAPALVVFKDADNRQVGRLTKCTLSADGVLSAEGDLPTGAVSVDLEFQTGGGIYNAAISTETEEG